MSNINNPTGAYGYSTGDQKFYYQARPYQTSAAVSAGYALAIGTDGKVAHAATNGTASLVIGFAQKAAASGATVNVILNGHVENVPAAGAVAAGDVLKRSTTTAGYVSATATPGVGEAIGVAIAASASNVVDIFVAKAL
jgi:hypothetical protein